MGYPTRAIWGMGTTIAIGTNASPPVYTPIAEVSKLTGPTSTKTMIDVTNLDSGLYSEYIGGITNPGTITFTINYQPADPSHILLENSQGSNPYLITFPKVGAETAGATLQQYAVLTKFDLSVDELKQISASVELQCTGAPVRTAGTPS